MIEDSNSLLVCFFYLGNITTCTINVGFSHVCDVTASFAGRLQSKLRVPYSYVRHNHMLKEDVQFC